MSSSIPGTFAELDDEYDAFLDLEESPPGHLPAHLSSTFPLPAHPSNPQYPPHSLGPLSVPGSTHLSNPSSNGALGFAAFHPGVQRLAPGQQIAAAVVIQPFHHHGLPDSQLTPRRVPPGASNSLVKHHNGHHSHRDSPAHHAPSHLRPPSTTAQGQDRQQYNHNASGLTKNLPSQPRAPPVPTSTTLNMNPNNPQLLSPPPTSLSHHSSQPGHKYEFKASDALATMPPPRSSGQSQSRSPGPFQSPSPGLPRQTHQSSANHGTALRQPPPSAPQTFAQGRSGARNPASALVATPASASVSAALATSGPVSAQQSFMASFASPASHTAPSLMLSMTPSGPNNASHTTPSAMAFNGPGNNTASHTATLNGFNNASNRGPQLSSSGVPRPAPPIGTTYRPAPVVGNNTLRNSAGRAEHSSFQRNAPALAVPTQVSGHQPLPGGGTGGDGSHNLAFDRSLTGFLGDHDQSGSTGVNIYPSGFGLDCSTSSALDGSCGDDGDRYDIDNTRLDSHLDSLDSPPSSPYRFSRSARPNQLNTTVLGVVERVGRGLGQVKDTVGGTLGRMYDTVAMVPGLIGAKQKGDGHDDDTEPVQGQHGGYSLDHDSHDFHLSATQSYSQLNRSLSRTQRHHGAFGDGASSVDSADRRGSGRMGGGGAADGFFQYEDDPDDPDLSDLEAHIEAGSRFGQYSKKRQQGRGVADRDRLVVGPAGQAPALDSSMSSSSTLSSLSSADTDHCLGSRKKNNRNQRAGMVEKQAAEAAGRGRKRCCNCALVDLVKQYGWDCVRLYIYLSIAFAVVIGTILYLTNSTRYCIWALSCLPWGIGDYIAAKFASAPPSPSPSAAPNPTTPSPIGSGAQWGEALLLLGCISLINNILEPLRIALMVSCLSILSLDYRYCDRAAPFRARLQHLLWVINFKPLSDLMALPVGPRTGVLSDEARCQDIDSSNIAAVCGGKTTASRKNNKSQNLGHKEASNSPHSPTHSYFPNHPALHNSHHLYNHHPEALLTMGLAAGARAGGGGNATAAASAANAAAAATAGTQIIANADRFDNVYNQ